MNVNIKLAIEAALKAGESIMKIYSDPNADFNIEKKADNSPLTIADKTSHNIITECLKKSPYRILSEEGSAISYEDRSKWKTLWIVDPLDGTKEFIKKNGEFTVNIALVQNGTPELGVIYVPVSGDLYYGSSETGAKKIRNLNLQKFQTESFIETSLPIVKNQTPFTVVASRSHMSTETSEYIEKLRTLHKDIAMTSIGSSLKLCLVAEGRADVYPRFAPTMEWDTAAGHAILKAAGKNLYNTDEISPLVYNKENLLNPSFIAK